MTLTSYRILEVRPKHRLPLVLDNGPKYGGVVGSYGLLAPLFHSHTLITTQCRLDGNTPVRRTDRKNDATLYPVSKYKLKASIVKSATLKEGRELNQVTRLALCFVQLLLARSSDEVAADFV